MPVAPFRYKKVFVPDEVHRECAALHKAQGSTLKVAKTLGIAECAVSELIEIGGVVKPTILAKVRARLEELKRCG